MTKRICSLFLAVLMLLSLSTCPGFRASAAAEEPMADEPFEDIGLTLRFPEVFDSTVGIFGSWPECLTGDGITCKAFIYVAMTPEDYNAAMSWEEVKTADEIAAARDAVGVVAYIMAIDGGRGPEEILDAFEADRKAYTVKHFTEIGKAGDVTFYLFERPERTETWLSGIAPEFAAEYTVLHDEMIKVLKNASFSVPAPDATIGQVLRFETEDTDGNPVNSRDLFARHAVTMFNVWETGCVPCIEEMEGLSEMNERLAEIDAAVVGICTDANYQPERCKAILAEHHVTHPNLMPFDDVITTLDIKGWPTSFFIGRNGRILAFPQFGAPTDLSIYEKRIDFYLIMQAPMDPFPAIPQSSLKQADTRVEKSP